MLIRFYGCFHHEYRALGCGYHSVEARRRFHFTLPGSMIPFQRAPSMCVSQYWGVRSCVRPRLLLRAPVRSKTAVPLEVTTAGRDQACLDAPGQRLQRTLRMSASSAQSASRCIGIAASRWHYRHQVVLSGAGHAHHAPDRVNDHSAGSGCNQPQQRGQLTDVPTIGCPSQLQKCDWQRQL